MEHIIAARNKRKHITDLYINLLGTRPGGLRISTITNGGIHWDHTIQVKPVVAFLATL